MRRSQLLRRPYDPASELPWGATFRYQQGACRGQCPRQRCSGALRSTRGRRMRPTPQGIFAGSLQAPGAVGFAALSSPPWPAARCKVRPMFLKPPEANRKSACAGLLRKAHCSVPNAIGPSRSKAMSHAVSATTAFRGFRQTRPVRPRVRAERRQDGFVAARNVQRDLGGEATHTHP